MLCQKQLKNFLAKYILKNRTLLKNFLTLTTIGATRTSPELNADFRLTINYRHIWISRSLKIVTASLYIERETEKLRAHILGCKQPVNYVNL